MAVVVHPSDWPRVGAFWQQHLDDSWRERVGTRVRGCIERCQELCCAAV